MSHYVVTTISAKTKTQEKTNKLERNKVVTTISSKTKTQEKRNILTYSLQVKFCLVSESLGGLNRLIWVSESQSSHYNLSQNQNPRKN